VNAGKSVGQGSSREPSAAGCFAHLDLAAYALPEEVAAELLSPSLVVYLDRVRDNLATMLAHLGGDPGRWRPHVKTAKIPEVLAEYARAGLRHFKCATTRETRVLLETLAAAGVDDPDVLLAQPLVAPALGVVQQLARRHPRARLAVLVEDRDGVREVPAELSLFVDVNPGMDRTGLACADVGAVIEIARAAGPRFRGVHCYDGHIHDRDPLARRRAAHAVYARAVELVDALRRANAAAAELITSGTPTFPDALAYEPFADLRGTVHRISPGTVVYHDQRCEEEDPTTGLVPAALVFARVVSRPAPGLVTCDAGSKALAAEAGDPCAVVLGRPELVCATPSEEHLPLHVRAGETPARGTTLLLVPRHVCPTVNLAETALLVERGRPPRAVAVAARAHDLGLRPSPGDERAS